MGREETSQEELYWRFLFAAAVILCLGTFVLKEGAELWGQVGGATVAILLLAGALS
jgi:hypothetical protein